MRPSAPRRSGCRPAWSTSASASLTSTCFRSTSCSRPRSIACRRATRTCSTTAANRATAISAVALADYLAYALRTARRRRAHRPHRRRIPGAGPHLHALRQHAATPSSSRSRPISSPCAFSRTTVCASYPLPTDERRTRRRRAGGHARPTKTRLPVHHSHLPEPDRRHPDRGDRRQQLVETGGDARPAHRRRRGLPSPRLHPCARPRPWPCMPATRPSSRWAPSPRSSRPVCAWAGSTARPRSSSRIARCGLLDSGGSPSHFTSGLVRSVLELDLLDSVSERLEDHLSRPRPVPGRCPAQQIPEGRFDEAAAVSFFGSPSRRMSIRSGFCPSPRRCTSAMCPAHASPAATHCARSYA